MNQIVDYGLSSLSYKLKMSRYMEELLGPLKEFGITTFGFGKIYDSGHIAMSINNKEWIEYTHIKKIYSNADYVKYLLSLKEIPYSHWQSFSKKNVVLKATQKFDFSNGCNISLKGDNSYNIYCIAGNNDDISVTAFLQNNFQILKKFVKFNHNRIESYIANCTSADMLKINHVKSFESNHYLPNSKQEKLYHLSDQLTKDLLKQYMGIQISPREVQCLDLLSQGHTTKSIARFLDLSTRTIEFYINNIKTKTGCAFKSDIIHLYNNFQRWLDDF